MILRKNTEISENPEIRTGNFMNASQKRFGLCYRVLKKHYLVDRENTANCQYCRYSAVRIRVYSQVVCVSYLRALRVWKVYNMI